MEFDKSRVFTAVNAGELKPGDKVIVADTLDLIATLVNTGKGEYWVIEEIKPEKFKQRFKARLLYHSCVNKDYCYSFAFAYLVERAENCTNCGNRGNSYCSCFTRDKSDDELSRAVCGNYIRLSEQKAEPQYRAFKDTDELIKVWCEKKGEDYTGYVAGVYHDMPHIWVKRKNFPKDRGSLITSLDDDIVYVGICQRTMDELFDDYTFLDGSPCGVEE